MLKLSENLNMAEGYVDIAAEGFGGISFEGWGGD